MHQNWAIFISGRGSNLAACLDEQAISDSHRLRLVVSSQANAGGILRARRAGIETLILDKKIDWSELDFTLRSLRIKQIFLLGFMRVVPPEFVQKWQGRILNLHPSLLPSYPGLKSIERAFSDRADLGATVHDVVSEVDAGRRLLQIRSLKGCELSAYAFETAEMFLHRDEQRIVREAFRRWDSTRRNAQA